MRRDLEAVPTTTAPAPERAPAAAPPGAARHAGVLRLQRAAGNAAVQRSLAQRSAAEAASGISPEVEDAIQAARGGGQALDHGVRTQMEGALGADFGGVRVHTDSRADSLSQALGARAFTTGSDVFFRRGEYSPGSPGGRELVAHELAHVVQQSGAPVGGALTLGPADDVFEREADGAAAAVADGLAAEVEPGAASAGGAPVQRALAEAPPRPAPETERPRDPESLRRLLESVPLVGLASLVGSLATGTLVPMLGPVVVHLDPFRTREVLRGLRPEQVRELLSVREARAAVLRAVKAVVDAAWPVGMGVSVDAGIGATFGFPLHLGGDVVLALFHATENTFKLLRRAELREALDVGYGAGGYLGTGRRKKSAAKGEHDEYGGGGAVGVQLEAGFKQILHQEFEFPIYEEAALLGLVLAVTGGGLGSPASMGATLLETIARTSADPMRYNTRTRVDVAMYSDLEVEASAGLRFGKTEAAEGETGGGRQTHRGAKSWRGWEEEAPDFGKSPGWTDLRGLSGLLNAELGGALSGNATFGVDVRMIGTRQNPRTGLREPERMEVDVLLEGSRASRLSASLPGLGALLPALNLETGMGIKATLGVQRGIADQPVVTFRRYSLYSKTGELEYVAGPGSETEVRLQNAPLQMLRQGMVPGFADFLNSVEDVRFRRRVSLGGPMRRKFKEALRRQKGVRALLNQDSKGWGVVAEGYLTATLLLSGEHLREILAAVNESARGIFSGGNGWATLWKDFRRMLDTGEAPEYLRSTLAMVARRVRVIELVAHERGGVGAAGGLHAAEGAKVRLHGYATGMVFGEQEIVGEGTALTVEEVMDLLLPG